MKTLLLRVGKPETVRGDYPVTLFFEESGDDWRTTAAASDWLPADLDVGSLPPNPINGQQLTKDDLQHAVLNFVDEAEVFGAIGEHLHRLLARGDVGTQWQRLREQYPRQTRRSTGLLTVLDIAPPELRLLPWELMRCDDTPFFADPLNSCLRARISEGPAPPRDLWPLRLLVVVGSEENDTKVAAEKELAGIRKALRGFRGKVEETYLLRPDQTRLFEVYSETEPHILHFIGHGDIDYDGVPFLSVFSDAQGQPWKWTRNTINRDLAATGWVPDLVLLNACRSSRQDAGRAEQQTAHQGVHSLGAAFMRLGVPAVLGMQGDIDGASAAAFSGAFYEQLADCKPLDQALMRGRLAIHHVQGYEHRDWCLPCLNLDVLPEQVLQLKYGVLEPERRRIERSPEFGLIDAFVDRAEPRRRLVRRVNQQTGDRGASGPPDLMAVVGGEQVGKTWLIYWCLRACALQGHEVRYIDFKPRGNKDYLAALRLIRRGPENDSQIQRPLSAEAFERFDQLSDPRDRESEVGEVFEAFREGLVRAAESEPLVLVFDHLEHLVESHLVCEKLIDRVGQGLVPGVRLVLVLKASDLSNLPASTQALVNPKETRVAVDGLPLGEFEALATEFFLHCDSKIPRPQLDTLVTLGKQLAAQQTAWTPALLGNLKLTWETALRGAAE